MKPYNNRKTKSQRSRGIALVTALLLLSLFTVMTLAMVIATSSDTLIDGYYRNFRGSFYASDSGLNAARQNMMNQLFAAAAGYVPYSGSPVSVGQENTIISNLVNTSTGFGAKQSITGGQTSSWPGSFQVSWDPACMSTACGANYTSAPTYFLTPTCQAQSVLNPTPPNTDQSTPPSCAGPPSNHWKETGYSYTYPYKLTVTGQSRANEQNTVEETGNLILNVTINDTLSTTTSFAAWGMFIDQSPICNGSYLVPGTITGPVFTNGNWNFGTSGGYIFTDKLGSHGDKFGYQFSGRCDQSTAGSDGSITPQFQSGYALGAAQLNPPTNSLSQVWAVLDGLGTNTATVNSGDLNAKLRDIHSLAYPSTGATTGVYLPYSNTTTTTCPTAPCMGGGGIYVEGNADSVVLSTANNQQIFTIKQGSTTTTVTLDLVLKTTTIFDGSTTKIVNDLPRNLNNSDSTKNEAALLYVNGSINGTSGGTTTGLSGPASGPAVQDGSAVTVTAANNISITGNILYKTEPVTLTTADSLVAGADHGQVLGIFTAGGNVNLNVPTAGSNLEIDASVATLSSGANWAIRNPGNQINQLNIVGGRIQNTVQNINSVHRNVYFDRRFASGGFAPPWFPSTTVTTTGALSAVVNPVVANRASWLNTTAQ